VKPHPNTLPPEVRAALGIYRAALPLVSSLLIPGYLARMVRRGNYRTGFWQRFGWYEAHESKRLLAHRWTWIRSISVGETLVALKLARTLHAARPDWNIALSVTTSTGYALATEAASEWLFPMYNPLDNRSVVERALAALRPERLILIEGEIWPNLVCACHERSVPIFLANARLSKRSAAGFARWKRWTAPFFGLLNWVGLPEEAERQRWISVGAPPRNLEVTGSIKFDEEGASRGPRLHLQETLLALTGMPETTPLLVAGSTHDGEEFLLAELLHQWRLTHPTLRLLLAPRHVERVPALLQELEPLGFKILKRTQLPAAAKWDILLLDTTGELKDWYSLATVAFVGKSLTAHGGQNPAEPALAAKAVVFGPNMENFESTVRLLIQTDAAVQVRNAVELQAQVEALLNAPDRRGLLGQNAVSALAIHQGATRRTAAAILGHVHSVCPPPAEPPASA
jgi:3-deoxy-D-manno-octulosonic-acid transferase